MAHVSSVPVQLAYRMGEFARRESISVPGEATRMPWELEEDMLLHPLFGGLPPMPPLTSPAPCFRMNPPPTALFKPTPVL